jgi:hypothetical protein
MSVALKEEKEVRKAKRQGHAMPTISICHLLALGLG